MAFTEDFPVTFNTVDPETQKNTLLGINIPAVTTTLLVAAAGAFAPELLPEALPELSELSASAPRLFQAITTRLQQSRLGELGARLGRWLLPREGEEFQISRARLTRVLSPSARQVRDIEVDALGNEVAGSGEFFRDADIELTEEALREIEEIERELRDGVEGERFYDFYDPQLFGIEGIQPDGRVSETVARGVLSNTVQRISNGLDGLYRYFARAIP